MKLPIYVPLLGMLLTPLVGCNSDENMQDIPDEKGGANLPIIDSGSANPAASRIINLPPSPVTTGPITQGTDNTDLLPFDGPEPLDEAVQTVTEDGTLTINVGNRFVKPLIIQMGCDGKLFQSHDESVSGITGVYCGDDKQAEKTR